MALCKNRCCMAPLGEHYWGDGYCSRRCLSQDDGYDPDTDKPLLDPNDPTGHAEICRNHDEVDAMLEAAEIDPRLPKIIYMRKRGRTHQSIGAQLGIGEAGVRKILQKCDSKLLRNCGLRKI